MRRCAFEWRPPEGGRLAILDQTLLPGEEQWLELDSVPALVEAIAALRVRGAPAIGIVAALGLVSALRRDAGLPRERFLEEVERAASALRAARPTAVNLAWAMDRMRRRARETPGAADRLLAALESEARAIWDEDREACRSMAEAGQRLLVPGPAATRADGVIRVLTHCNTGFLATGGIGTALGVVHLAAERGMRLHVWVDETRPLLQGSRLTAWELREAGIPHAVITDGAAAALMRQGKVDVALVGADRIAANGDVANKVGTYALALAAARHRVPFYVVAPTSSFDPACATGAAIPIEERDAAEVTRPFGRAVAPEGSAAYNPAFDVTDGELVTGYLTERGLLKPPFRELG